MYVSHNSGVTFVSKYDILSRTEYEQAKAEPPFARVSTYVRADCYCRLKDIFRKKQYPVYITFFVIAALVIGYSIYLAQSAANENDALFAIMAAAAALGIGITFMIRSYLSSGKFLKKLNTADGSDGQIRCDYCFYADEFSYQGADEAAFSVDTVMVIPYGCISRIAVCDDAVALADKDDRGFYMMRKDMPSQLTQRLCELCGEAKIIDRRTML